MRPLKFTHYIFGRCLENFNNIEIMIMFMNKLLKIIKKHPYVPELILALIILSGGFILIGRSSGINSDIANEVYDFEIELNLADDTANSKLNFFYWEHNFSQDKGVIGFNTYFNNSINYISIDLPSFVNNESLDLKVFDCSSAFECDDKIKHNLKIATTENPVNNPKYTSLLISNFSEPLIKNKFVLTYENMHIVPNGVFNIFNGRELLDSSGDAPLRFNIGKNYGCIEGCFIESESKGIYKHRENDDKNIRLNLPEQDDDIFGRPLRFKLQTFNSNLELCKNLLNGLGISLITVSIVILLELRFTRRKYFKWKS